MPLHKLKRSAAGSGAVVPAGLIIPFNDTVIPDGWTRFSAADDKFIIGAGTTYSPGDSGSSLLTPSSTTAGAHTNVTGATGMLILVDTTHFDPSGSNQYFSTRPGYYTSAGGHSHTISNYKYMPKRVDIVLIKADSESSQFPTKGIVMAIQELSGIGLSQVYDDDRFLYGSTSVSEVAEAMTGTVGSAGSHNHSGGSGYDWQTSGPDDLGTYKGSDVGAHTGHSISLSSATNNLKKFYLSAWTNASADFNVEAEMIGMYESLTPPDGWLLCDGTNGTPDMRDYFVVTSTTGKHGTNHGDGTISSSNALSSYDNYHTHDIPGTAHGWIIGGYHNYGYNRHSHTVTITDAVYLPPYYALVFIKKAT